MKNKVTTQLVITVTTEFDDTESDEETLRYCFEEDIEDTGYSQESIQSLVERYNIRDIKLLSEVTIQGTETTDDKEKM